MAGVTVEKLSRTHSSPAMMVESNRCRFRRGTFRSKPAHSSDAQHVDGIVESGDDPGDGVMARIVLTRSAKGIK
jgi:hypothetical protein